MEVTDILSHQRAGPGLSGRKHLRVRRAGQHGGRGIVHRGNIRAAPAEL
jgi:hypothetical protein